MKFIKRTLISEISSAGNFLGDYNSVFPQWPHLTTRWAKREDQYFCRDSNICAFLCCNGQLLHTKVYVNSIWNHEGNYAWILTENRSTMAFQDDVFPGIFCMLSHNWGLSHRMWEIEPKALSVFPTQFPLPNDRNISVAVFTRTCKETASLNDMENRAYHCHKDSKWKGDKHLFFKPLRCCTPLI